jgi:hypothetical protein
VNAHDRRLDALDDVGKGKWRAAGHLDGGFGFQLRVDS